LKVSPHIGLLAVEDKELESNISATGTGIQYSIQRHQHLRISGKDIEDFLECFGSFVA
jgi:hypothetical protein